MIEKISIKYFVLFVFIMNPIQPFPCKGKGLLSIVTKLINVIIDI
mgnify:CR=1 FL=1